MLENKFTIEKSIAKAIQILKEYQIFLSKNNMIPELLATNSATYIADRATNEYDFLILITEIKNIIKVQINRTYNEIINLLLTHYLSSIKNLFNNYTYNLIISNLIYNLSGGYPDVMTVYNLIADLRILDLKNDVFEKIQDLIHYNTFSNFIDVVTQSAIREGCIKDKLNEEFEGSFSQELTGIYEGLEDLIKNADKKLKSIL